VFDQPPPPGNPPVSVVCAWCKAHLGGAPLACHIPVSHGICAPCGNRLLAEWGASLDPANQGTRAEVTIIVAGPVSFDPPPPDDPWVDLGGEG
jgi:hypothetical protein